MSEKISFDSKNSQDNGEEWEGLAEAVAQLKQEQKDAAPGRAKKHFEEARSIEMDFARRSATIASDGGKMSKKEFEKWEDAISDELRYADDQFRIGRMIFRDKAEAMQHMVAYRVDTELHKTIEAQAGHYYFERDRELRTAIKERGGPSEKSDLALLNGFYPAVAAHLDYKYMSPGDVRDFGSDAYERQRTEAHNDAIRHLNALNHLAKKYGTRPFTARDFWTSDLCDKRAQTPAIAMVMRYDRDIVEEYYAIAFSSDIKKRLATSSRSFRGDLYY